MAVTEIIHRMRVEPEGFERMRKRIKKVEARLFDEKRQRVRLGDIIEFENNVNSQDILRVTVVGLIRTNTFSELVSLLDCNFCFGRPTLEILQRLRSRYGNKENIHGVLGMFVRPLEQKRSM